MKEDQNHLASPCVALEIFKSIRSDWDINTIKERVESARERALKIFPYQCIKRFRFVEPRCAMHPLYKDLVEKRDRGTRHVLDVGCCMGTDIRKMIFDKLINLERGDTVVGIDIAPEFFQIGFEIFEDEDQVRDKFFPCDLLDSDQMEQFRKARGPFNLIYCGSVFHLLEKEQTVNLAKAIFGLMSSGGIFFGRTGGSLTGKPEESEHKERKQKRYLHTEESLKELLESIGFVNVKIEKNDEPDRENPNMLAFSAEK